MKNIKKLLSENFHFLVVKFSIYLNRRVFVMYQFITDHQIQLSTGFHLPFRFAHVRKHFVFAHIYHSCLTVALILRLNT